MRIKDLRSLASWSLCVFILPVYLDNSFYMNHLSVWIIYTEIPQATVSNANFLYA